jgi:nanoRNase/pAp phosphatase (c-di-AMP/oligoRNAs hydrolase)
VSSKPILTTPRAPRRALIQARFTPFLGKRFVSDNPAISGQLAAAHTALKRARPRIVGRDVNVFTQWVGDPDALGSALLLEKILSSLGAHRIRILTGSLGHPQNRAMVQACGIQLHDPNRDRFPDGLNCMVDSSPPLGMSNTTQVDPVRDYFFVADHHTERDVVEAHCRERGVRRVRMAFVGLDVGSTSAFLTGLACTFHTLDDLGPEGRAASALGIYTDTSGLLHSATALDFCMFEKLTRDADTRRLLHELRDYRLPPEWHGLGAPAYLRVEQLGKLRIAPMGAIPAEDRDVIAEIADELLRVEDTALGVAIAVTKEGTEISVRADSRLFNGDGARVVSLVRELLEGSFHGISGYKYQRTPPHRVEGGAHLPHGDPREARFLEAAVANDDADAAAVEHCRACGHFLIEKLRALKDDPLELGASPKQDPDRGRRH